MSYFGYNNSEDGELISAESADIPPLPYETNRTTADNIPTLHSKHDDVPPYPRTYYNSGGFLNFFASIIEWIVDTKSAILCIIVFIICILIWPIGLFLLFCLFCYVVRGG